MQGKYLFVFSEEDGVTCVCVFTLSCFLAKFVGSLAKACWREWRNKLPIVEMCFLGIVFICSMEYWVCFLCCKSRRKVVNIETIVELWGGWEGWDGSVCHRTCEGLSSLSFSESHVAVGGIELWSHRGFCVSGKLGRRRALSPFKWSRGELRARCQELNCASNRHNQFLGWHKVVPLRGRLNVSNLYSTGIPCKESIN